MVHQRLALLQRLLPGPQGRVARLGRRTLGLRGAVAEVPQVPHGHHVAGGGRPGMVWEVGR